VKAEIMTEFETMRADLEAELAEARERVAETAADAAAADAARLDAVAARDAMQLAVGPLGETIGAPIALRLGGQIARRGPSHGKCHARQTARRVCTRTRCGA
jgi:hypothetical protein